MVAREKEAKRYFHLISHLLHDDKLGGFLDSQVAEGLTTEQRLKYIKNLTSAYVELSNIYTSLKEGNHKKEEGVRLFKNVHKILIKELDLNERIENLREEIESFKYPQDFQKASQNTKQKAKKKAVYVTRYKVDYRLIAELEAKTARIVSILAKFKEYYESSIEIKALNLTINLISEVFNMAKSSFLRNEECVALMRRYEKIILNYQDFTFDWSIAGNLKESRKYGLGFRGSLIAIIFVTLINNPNVYVKDIFAREFNSLQLETFAYTIDSYRDRYSPQRMEETDFKILRNIYRK